MGEGSGVVVAVGGAVHAGGVGGTVAGAVGVRGTVLLGGAVVGAVHGLALVRLTTEARIGLD